jgi:hypothetical protein
MTWGAYIGEVIRRLEGGHWEKDSDVAGPDTYPIHHGQGQSFVVGWCGKRILNGAEDNVWHKFQVVVLGEGNSGVAIEGDSPKP